MKVLRRREAEVVGGQKPRQPKNQRQTKKYYGRQKKQRETEGALCTRVNSNSTYALDLRDTLFELYVL